MSPPGTPGSEAEEVPGVVFYYDFNSPYAYLAAERVNQVMPEAPEWQPVALPFIHQANDRVPWSRQDLETKEGGMREIERRAAERGLPPIKWLDDWPVGTYSLTPLRAAVFAKESGRAVSFSLAAFRQFFAGGNRLDEADNVLMAAAACELHPRAVLAALERDSIKEKLKQATEDAIARGVPGVPTVAVGDQLFWGDDRLEEAAEVAAAG
jgi:2-hydroxychromene-2-carboxylate isomerase